MDFGHTPLTYGDIDFSLFLANKSICKMKNLMSLIMTHWKLLVINFGY